MRLTEIDHAASALRALGDPAVAEGDVRYISLITDLRGALLLELSAAIEHAKVSGAIEEAETNAPLPARATEQVNEFVRQAAEAPGYAEFADLFERHGVPVADAMGRWFRDVGGWDTSTPNDRTELFHKADGYYKANPRTAGAPAATTTFRDVNLKICPRCEGVHVKFIPAGVSKKTGKPYKEFYACDTQGCDTRWGNAAAWLAEKAKA